MKTDPETVRYQRDRIYDVVLRVIKAEPDEAPEPKTDVSKKSPR